MDIQSTAPAPPAAEGLPGARVRITNPELPCYGREGVIDVIYYDHKHTGSSPDLWIVAFGDGTGARILSTSGAVLAPEVQDAAQG